MQNNRRVGGAQETRAMLELERLGYKIIEETFDAESERLTS